MKPYPTLIPKTLEDVISVLIYIVKERRYDVLDFNNLQNVFMSGRKVGKIPASSADIDDTDRVGDFNYDPDYLYIVVDDSGAAWRRIALSSW